MRSGCYTAFRRMDKELRERYERWDRAHERAMARMDRADARMDRAEARIDRAEARLERAEARMAGYEARAAASDARFEKRMKGIQKLALAGLQEFTRIRAMHREMVREHKRSEAELTIKINALIQAQIATHAEMKAFIASLRIGGNGRKG